MCPLTVRSSRSIKTLSFFISFNNSSYFSPIVSPRRHRFGVIWRVAPQRNGLWPGPHFPDWRVAYFRFRWSCGTSKTQWRHKNDKCFIFVHGFFTPFSSALRNRGSVICAHSSHAKFVAAVFRLFSQVSHFLHLNLSTHFLSSFLLVALQLFHLDSCWLMQPESKI